MDTNKDYYAILGVLPFAGKRVISQAYKILAQHYHPDRFNGLKEKEEANSRMLEINEAYGVLSNRAKKEEYDRVRRLLFGGSNFRDSKTDRQPLADFVERSWDREFLKPDRTNRPNESLILVVLGVMIFLAVVFGGYFYSW